MKEIFFMCFMECKLFVNCFKKMLIWFWEDFVEKLCLMSVKSLDIINMFLNVVFGKNIFRNDINYKYNLKI